MVNVIKGGSIIRTSRNLRGMLAYCRVSAAREVWATKLPDDKGSLQVLYSDGATSRANFESYAVMREWIAARRVFRAAKINA